MENKNLLHVFSPTKNVSPFDINMAYEACYDAVVPYSDVTLEDVPGLTQDTIFSRGPKGVKRTGIFIGGRDLWLALDMLDAARKAMVPPFEISVFLDPSGAITTAAAIIASVEHWLGKQNRGQLTGAHISIFGLGPVGVCAGVIAASNGARVQLVSHLNAQTAQETADKYNKRFATAMTGADGSSDAATQSVLASSDAVITAAKAGVCVLKTSHLASASKVAVVADVNAVPPAGIEGIGMKNMGKPLAGTGALAIGPLAIGDIKYKVHARLFQKMFDAEKPIYVSYPQAFEIAREIVAEEMAKLAR